MHYIIKFPIIIKIFFLRFLRINKCLSTDEHPVTFLGKLLHKKVGWLILTGMLIQALSDKK